MMRTAHRTHGSGAEPDEGEALITPVIRHGGDLRACETCREEQNGAACELVEGVILGSLHELERWIPETDRLLVFWIRLHADPA